MTDGDQAPYDAILLMSFGGPEGPDDVMPFLERVVAGKNVPRERLEEVAEHYQHFGGKSPLNDHNRALLGALRAELEARGPRLPIYWGNRNWHPLVEDTLREMKADGVKRAIAFVTSAYSSYSGCRQYREDIQRAREAIGEGAPTVDKIRVFYNHPGFVEPMAARLRDALARFPEDRRGSVPVAFTAHSIPLSMAKDGKYQRQLEEACRLVAERSGDPAYALVWQSRSGPPQVPWLEPDVCDHLRALRADGHDAAVICPIGFLSDHIEVVWDLDNEARDVAAEIGMRLERSDTVGEDPAYVSMVRDLIVERLPEAQREALGVAPVERESLGSLGPSHDVCPPDCCKYVPRRPPGVGGPPGAGARPGRPSGT